MLLPDPPARYFPITRGVYEVAAGLKPLGTDFGNGSADAKVFQLDSDFAKFRASKLACRTDAIEKYFQQSNLDSDAERAWVDWLILRFTAEYPQFFLLEADANGRRLTCRHTEEEICLNPHNELRNDSKTLVPYRSAFDALANQVSEDICLTRCENSRDWNAR